MTIQRFTLLILLIGLAFFSCINDHSEYYLKKVDFDPSTRILKVDFANDPDTSIQQIILLSDIRKSGFGILLNIDEHYNASVINEIKAKFIKQDINAVHVFSIDTEQAVSHNIQAGIEGAKFIWILSNSDSIFSNPNFETLRKAIEQTISNQGIIVTN